MCTNRKTTLSVLLPISLAIREHLLRAYYFRNKKLKIHPVEVFKKHPPYQIPREIQIKVKNTSELGREVLRIVAEVYSEDLLFRYTFNPVQDGSFRGCSRMRGQKGPHP